MEIKELIGKELNEEILKEVKKLENKGYCVTVCGNKIYAIEEEELY